MVIAGVSIAALVSLGSEAPWSPNLGMLLLGVWLIVHGLEPLINLSFSGLDTIMGIVAIVAGALILVGR